MVEKHKKQKKDHFGNVFINQNKTQLILNNTKKNWHFSYLKKTDGYIEQNKIICSPRIQ